MIIRKLIKLKQVLDWWLFTHNIFSAVFIKLRKFFASSSSCASSWLLILLRTVLLSSFLLNHVLSRGRRRVGRMSGSLCGCQRLRRGQRLLRNARAYFVYMACVDNVGLASHHRMTSIRCLAQSWYYAQGWALPFDLRSFSSLQGKVQTSLTLLLLRSSVHRILSERSSRRNSLWSLWRHGAQWWAHRGLMFLLFPWLINIGKVVLLRL